MKMILSDKPKIVVLTAARVELHVR